MKKCKLLIYLLTVFVLFSACGKADETGKTAEADKNDGEETVTRIELSDTEIKVDGIAAGRDEAASVYLASDIVYYEAGKDFTYGEGTEKDAHPKELADAHTVVHVSRAGTYEISGRLSKGQIAVDLGEDAKEDPEAVVTLILNGVDITCEVAPAVIFYRVYECGNSDAKTATKDVDTSKAGANVIVADGTENNVSGSYVARIYKPDSVLLNEAGTEVEDAKKLHKYDGAFYSKMSMNVFGGEENSGVLNIRAENEGLGSELHLTVNGGNINIRSGNDGINTNEDGVSVTTVNGGVLDILVTGETGEGDGIDSNGWLVIRGGTVVSAACSFSADAGIDSDMGIHILGGTVIASGSMLDRIEDGGQTYAVFSFIQKQKGGQVISLQDENGKKILEQKMENTFSVLIFSDPALKEGSYTLWSDGKQLAGSSADRMEFGKPDGMQEGKRPEKGTPPDFPDRDKIQKDFVIPEEGEARRERPERPDGETSLQPTPPFGLTLPDESELPEGMAPPEKPDERFSPIPFENQGAEGEVSKEFKIQNGANLFSGIREAA